MLFSVLIGVCVALWLALVAWEVKDNRRSFPLWLGILLWLLALLTMIVAQVAFVWQLTSVLFGVVALDALTMIKCGYPTREKTSSYGVGIGIFLLAEFACMIQLIVYFFTGVKAGWPL